MPLQRIGIDTGGSSLKSAVVDVDRGVTSTQVEVFPTPAPATPVAIAEVVLQILGRFSAVDGALGFAFPSVIRNGVTLTAAHVDSSWIGIDGRRLLQEATGRRVALLNDADAAGLAEMRFGAGRGQDGTVIMLTLGTGIGSAIFHRGQLLPNTEFGHMEIRGEEAEQRAAARIRTLQRLDWPEWADRLNEVLESLHELLWPDLFIVGGGVVENWTDFGELLQSPARIVPAQLGNRAGIIGAALAASELEHEAESAMTPATP